MGYPELVVRFSALTFAFGAMVFAPGIHAQSALLEEVIVTAQKREESLQDVPIAISALTGDQLNTLGVSTPNDLMKVFPNLILKPGSALNTGFSIRGVGTDNFHVTAQQAVGQYLDEVSLISPFISNFGLFDMERVEVLRGPQNTLFGRNTTGGAVNMISRKPEVGGELNGYARVNGGNKGRIDFEGAVGMPLGDSAAARVAFQTKNRGDIYDNLWNGGETGDEERHSGRIQLAFEPGDALRILANGHVGIQRGDRQPYKGIGLLDVDRLAEAGLLSEDGQRLVSDEPLAALINPDRGLLCPTLGDGTSQFEDLNNCASLRFDGASLVNISTPDWQDVWDAAPNMADIDFYGGFLRLEYDFPSFTFTSLSSYDQVEVQFIENTGGQQFAGFFPGQDAVYKVFQQEVRLTSTHEGPWRWILGGYYSYEDDVLATIIRNGSPGTPPFTVIPSIEIQQEVDIYSVYGKIDIDITDNLTVFGGLRWTQDTKDGISIARIAPGTDTGIVGGARLPDNFFTDLDRLRSITAAAAAAGGGCPPPPLPCQSPDLPVEQTIKELGGKIGANLQFTEDLMGYVSFSRGFKSGAFDTRALAAFAGTADRPVGPEFLNAIETGVKAEICTSLQINAAVFRYDWTDLQIFDVDENGNPAYLNVPETEIIGAELDTKWAPGYGWFVSAGIGWLDSEIKDDGGLNSVREGARLNHTPEITFNGVIIKETPIENGVLTLQTDFHYSDEFNSSLDGNPQTRTSDAFFINARASYRFGNQQQFELSVWGENLSSEKTCYDISNNATLTVANSCTQNPGLAFFGGSFQYDF